MGVVDMPAEGTQIEFKRFLTIWPNYIDANKTIPEGRRIAKEHACRPHSPTPHTQTSHKD